MSNPVTEIKLRTVNGKHVAGLMKLAGQLIWVEIKPTNGGPTCDDPAYKAMLGVLYPTYSPSTETAKGLEELRKAGGA